MRYVLIVLGVLVGFIAIVALIGWSLPVQHRASVERSYRASRPALFGLITDVPAFPTWRRDLVRVESLPDEGGHKRWSEAPKNGAAITYAAERLEPGRLLVTRIVNKNLPFGGSWTYELLPQSESVTTLRITEDGEVYNPIFRFVSRFVMGHDATMKQYLDAVGRRFAQTDETSTAPAAIQPR
jgi:hypothetical protein